MQPECRPIVTHNAMPTDWVFGDAKTGDIVWISWDYTPQKSKTLYWRWLMIGVSRLCSIQLPEHIFTFLTALKHKVISKGDTFVLIDVQQDRAHRLTGLIKQGIDGIIFLVKKLMPNVSFSWLQLIWPAEHQDWQQVQLAFRLLGDGT